MKKTFDNKYTVIFDESTGKLEALRYDEPWQDISGNGLVLAMLQEVNYLRKSLEVCRSNSEQYSKELQDTLDKLGY